MFTVFFSISTTAFLGVATCLFVRQYRRVAKRDAARRRIQSYQPTKTASSSSKSTTKTEYDPFDHSLHWYPVAFSHEIDCGSNRPFGFHLLNEPLCLYRSNDGKIVCVLDLCPHRSAPLSLGQITKEGNLECIYHGWQYGANGQCVYIPSTSKKSNTASLVCARTIPVHEQYGFIWVWPGKRELANSDLIPHQILSGLQSPSKSYLLSPEDSFYLDIPYDLMVDNLLDMAHIDFTHDGTIGKRSQASCIRSERIEPSPYLSTHSEAVTFKIAKHERTVPCSAPDYSYFHFIPPCFIRLEHHGPKKGTEFVQVFFIIPTAEKKMRLLLQFYRNFALYKWIEYIPGYDYLTKMFDTKVVDQDVLLLNGIHRNIEQMGAKPLGTTVSADAPIKAFRRYQSKAIAKFQSLYFPQGSWKTFGKSNDDEIKDIDIEDLHLS